jgi:hypothetical protein
MLVLLNEGNCKEKTQVSLNGMMFLLFHNGRLSAHYNYLACQCADEQSVEFVNDVPETN